MAEPKKTSAERIKVHVAAKLEALNNKPEPAGRAELAKMRRGIGQKPGNDPELWRMLFENMPKELESKGREASPAEWAIHSALTLYALHQQSKDIHTENMNCVDQALGRAVARLIDGNPDRLEAVRRRFNAMATSADISELTWHLRGIIQLLKDESIPLDYPKLAEQLYRYQDLNQMATIRLNWGRDFYWELNRMSKPNEAGKEERV